MVSQTGGGDLTRLEVRLVAARLHELQRQLPDLTGGEGVLEPTFDRIPASARPAAGASELVAGASWCPDR